MSNRDTTLTRTCPVKVWYLPPSFYEPNVSPVWCDEHDRMEKTVKRRPVRLRQTPVDLPCGKPAELIDGEVRCDYHRGVLCSWDGSEYSDPLPCDAPAEERNWYGIPMCERHGVELMLWRNGYMAAKVAKLRQEYGTPALPGWLYILRHDDGDLKIGKADPGQLDRRLSAPAGRGERYEIVAVLKVGEDAEHVLHWALSCSRRRTRNERYAPNLVLTAVAEACGIHSEAQATVDRVTASHPGNILPPSTWTD
ncbi:hypothetical protein SUDANB15_02618 [Streptomyces sp. enrichment culture]|uniref:hypothetical protein n=1 Tax=Streptomyces sp. enrichment culture TaxID=1795815 RepID=UPI003F55E627